MTVNPSPAPDSAELAEIIAGIATLDTLALFKLLPLSPVLNSATRDAVGSAIRERFAALKQQTLH